MKKRFGLKPLVTAILLVSSAVLLLAAGKLNIRGTQADLDAAPQTLTIDGLKFGSDPAAGFPPPDVLLDLVPLVVASYTFDTQIVAELPPGTLPGDYELTVTDSDSTGGIRTETVTITIAASGPQRLEISGAEPDVGAGTILISGANLGDGATLPADFDVRLFVPDPAMASFGTNVPLVVAGFDPATQEIIALLPGGLFPGTFRLTVSKAAGNETDILDVTLGDLDLDPINEAQTLSLVGSDVTLSNVGGTGGGTVSVNDADFDPGNELQTLTRADSTVTLSDGGAVSIEDDDANPMNEIQTLSQAGNTVTLSGGGAVSIDDNDWTDDGTNIFRTSGNVGIGTETPAQKLHVFSNTSPAEIWIDATGGTPALGNAVARFKNDLGNEGQVNMGRSGLPAPLANTLILRNKTPGPDGDILFQTRDTFNMDRMIIKSDTGKVGIGTTTPTQMLHIASSSAPTELLLDASGATSAFGNAHVRFINDQGSLGFVGMSRSGIASPNGNSLFMRSVSPTADFLLLTSDVERMIVKADGKVGVGTLTPTALLDVNGDVIVSGNLTAAPFNGGIIEEPPGPPGPPAVNPLQVALLRWYEANEGGATFPVGDAPFGVAFDGANIWVANENSDDVTKVRASDGTNLGTFPVGDLPVRIAFDGANVWVTNFNDDTLSKLRASDGVDLGTFPVGDGPFGVAFDGANIWAVSFHAGTVSKLRASDGADLGSFPVGNQPKGVAFDGANIWVANGLDDTVSKLRASDGADLGTFSVGQGPRGVAFDGANIWVTNITDDTVTKH